MKRKHALKLIQVRPQVGDLLVPELQQLLQLSDLLLPQLEQRLHLVHRAHRFRRAGDRADGRSDPGTGFLVGSVEPGREAQSAEADAHSLGGTYALDVEDGRETTVEAAGTVPGVARWPRKRGKVGASRRVAAARWERLRFWKLRMSDYL